MTCDTRAIKSTTPGCNASTAAFVSFQNGLRIADPEAWYLCVYAALLGMV